MSQVHMSPAEGAAGSRQALTFGIPDTCPQGQRMSEVFIQLPRWGMAAARPLPRAGWEVFTVDAVNKNGPLGRPGEVRWRASSAAHARPAGEVAEFVVQARLPPRAAWLEFEVKARCGGDRPVPDAHVGGRPAVDARVVLRVHPPAQAPVEVSHAWVQALAPGQQDTAMFMTLEASQDLKLVGAESPAAGRIEIRNTLLGKLKGYELRSFTYLPLQAGQAVRLAPRGPHLAVTKLQAPPEENAELPVTLRFEDAEGVASERTLRVPVRTLPGRCCGG